MAQSFANTAEVERYLEQQSQMLRDGVITQKQYNDAVNNAKVGIKNYTESLEASVNQLKKSVLNYATDIVKGEEGVSLYNKTIQSSADALTDYSSKWKYAGKAIELASQAAAKYVIAVNEQADELFKQYKDISRNGLVTGMDDVFKNLQSMGYTMKEIGKMGSLLKENATTLATLGGTAAQGTKQFSDLSREIQYSEFGTELQRMGMTVDDINKGSAGYLKIQQQSGQLQKQSQAELIQHTKEYLIEADRLTKITGMTREQQNKVMEEAYAQEQFAATQYKLRTLDGSPEAMKLADRNDALVKQMSAQAGPQAAKALQKYLSGTMTEEEAVKFRRTLGSAAQKIDAGITNVDEIMDAAKQGAKEYLVKWNTQAQYGNAEKIGLNTAETVKLAGQAAGKSSEDASKSAQEQQKFQRSGMDKGAKNLVDINKAQRNQTMTYDKFVNNGVEPVTEKFADFTTMVEKLTSTPLNKLIGGQGKVGAGAAPAPTPTGGGTPAAQPAPADKLIDFGGGTGDRAHFDKLNSAVQSSFLQLAQEYNTATGKKLRVNSAYRSPEEQAGVNSGNNPKAAPGKSLHQQGKAIDINSAQVAELKSLGMLGKYGFSTISNDPPHIQMPSAATGGIIGGPKSGYTAMLHGTEAVVPLPDGKTIPVQVKGGGIEGQQTKIIAMKIGKLDVILRGMQKFNDTTAKILQRQQ